MKLEYLYIDGYKGLKRLKLQFKEQTGVVPVDFLIGCNGSGKSSVLEAVGLIFTRIMQNELPGFIFELKYRMPDGTGIYVKPQKKGFCDASGRRRKLYVELEKNGKTQQLYSIPDEYLPDRIISYCSGANSSMEDILIRSPRASLASDLYDPSLAMDVENGEGPVSGKEEHPGESSVARGEAAEEILSFYERLDVNPRVLFLDAVTSKFILPALFAVMPFDMQDDHISEKALRYATLRKKLLKRLNIRLIPAAFSLRIDDTRLEEAADRPQMSILRRLLSQDVKGKALSNCVIHRTSTDRLEEDGSLAGETAAVFLFESWEAEGEKVFYHPMLQRYFDGSPFALISTLLTAWREGVIREIHFSYPPGSEEG